MYVLYGIMVMAATTIVSNKANSIFFFSNKKKIIIITTLHTSMHTSVLYVSTFIVGIWMCVLLIAHAPPSIWCRCCDDLVSVSRENNEYLMIKNKYEYRFLHFYSFLIISIVSDWCETDIYVDLLIHMQVVELNTKMNETIAMQWQIWSSNFKWLTPNLFLL